MQKSKTVKTQTHKVDLLSIIRTRHRQLISLPYYDPRYSHHFPYFSYGAVDLMLRDSRIRYGLGLIKGPLFAYTKFFNEEEAEDPAVQQAIIDLEYHYAYEVKGNEKTVEFVIKNLNRFWQNGLMSALKGIEWGYSPNQVVYRRDSENKIQYDKLIHYGVHHVKPVSRGHDITGIYLKKQKRFIPIPKSYIYVHRPEHDSFTGQSHLVGAHIPWHETWVLGGARDIRRIWYFKNAYDSGTLYCPQEAVVVNEVTGETKPAEEVGALIMEAGQTGSYRVFPKPQSASNKNERTWDYEPPKANPTPDGMPEYLQDMRIEILEGMDIPPEVVENANSNGLGSASGRMIPMLAFYASISPISVNIIEGFSDQVIRPMCRVNGLDDEYEVNRILPKNYDPVGQNQDTIEAQVQTDNATTKPTTSSS